MTTAIDYDLRLKSTIFYIPMPLDPFKSEIYFDLCAFDGGTPEEQSASLECQYLLEQKNNDIRILYSVQKEIDFPNTPNWIKRKSISLIGTKETSLEAHEFEKLRDVEKIIFGNGNLEKRKPDCRHVFETIRYGDYFITTDNGILKHSDTIFKKYHIYIMKPSELLVIMNKYQSQKQPFSVPDWCFADLQAE